MVPISGNRDLEVRQDLEEEALELDVGAVDLVDEEDGGPLRLGDGLEQRALQEEVLREDVRLLRRHRPLVPLLQPDPEDLLRVVPLVERRRRVEALVALEPDQVRPVDPGQDLGDLGLADARVPLDEERLPQRRRQVHRRRDGRVGDVGSPFHQGLDVSDLLAHAGSSVDVVSGGRPGHPLYSGPGALLRVRPAPARGLVVLGSVDVGRHRRVDGHLGDPLRGPAR